MLSIGANTSRVGSAASRYQLARGMGRVVINTSSPPISRSTSVEVSPCSQWSIIRLRPGAGRVCKIRRLSEAVTRIRFFGSASRK